MYTFNKTLLFLILFLCIFIKTQAKTFKVTQELTQDLIQAIDNANNNATKDTIKFDFTVNKSSYQFELTQALPTISNPVYIDGTSVDSYSDKPAIIINGKDLFNTGFIFAIGSGGSKIEGFNIQQFTKVGILIKNTSNITITNNYIGTNLEGTTEKGQTRIGVKVNNSNNITIGGQLNGNGNLISGCIESGILFKNVSKSHIYGNFIGTNYNGLDLIPNNTGIVLRDNSSNNYIGKKGANQFRNIISGNDNEGILFDDTTSANPDVSQNIIAKNYIGVASDGTSSLGNYTGIKLIKNTENNLTINNKIAYNTNGYLIENTSAFYNRLSRNEFYCISDSVVNLNGFLPPEPPQIHQARTSFISGKSGIHDTIEVFYKDNICNSASGKTFIDTTIADNNGNWKLSGNFDVKRKVIANATTTAGVTSEFSDTVCVVDPEDAGNEQFIYSSSTTLNAQPHPDYNWVKVDQLNPVIISNESSATSSLTQVPLGETKLVWYDNELNCPGHDTLTINRLNNIPSAPEAGKDTSICTADSILLIGNHPPASYNVKWEINQNANVKIDSRGFRNYKAMVSNLKSGDNKIIYQWNDPINEITLTDTVNVHYQNGLVVSNELTHGCGSFRKAIKLANTESGKDTITFSNGVNNVKTTSLSPYSLPYIKDSVLIDGFSHPDYKDHPVVSIERINDDKFSPGLNIESKGVTIRGLHFKNIARPVSLKAGNTRFYKNYIGFNKKGKMINDFEGIGIIIKSANNYVYKNKIGGAKGNKIPSSEIGMGILLESNISPNIYTKNNLIRKNIFKNNQTGVYLKNTSFKRKVVNNKISRNSFICNFKGIKLSKGSSYDSIANKSYPSPKITNISSNQIEGKALPGDSIELYYADSLCGQSQGQEYFETVKADASGNWNYNGTLKNYKIVALAIGPNGNTSSFSSSPCIAEGVKELSTGKDFAKIIPEDTTGKWENIDNKGFLYEVDSSVAYHTVLNTGKHRLVWEQQLNNCPSAKKDTDTVTYKIKSDYNNVKAGKDISLCNQNSYKAKGFAEELGELGVDYTLQWIPISNGITISEPGGKVATIENLQNGINAVLLRANKFNGNDTTIHEDIKIISKTNNPLRVSSVTDSGCGSLRYAVNYADSLPGEDTVRFASFLNNKSIHVNSSINLDSNKTMINGDITGDQKADIKILGGNKKNDPDTIFTVNGHNNTIKNLNLLKKPSLKDNLKVNGIVINGNKNQLYGNYIGTSLKQEKTKSSGDLFFGLLLNSSANDNKIGNGTKIQANFIGNCFIGAAILGNKNIINKNYIGGNINLKTQFSNKNLGVGITGNANQMLNNDIVWNEQGNDTTFSGLLIQHGDNNYLESNVIAFNNGPGILIDSIYNQNDQATGNTLFKNRLFANKKQGIQITGANQQNIPSPVIDSVSGDTIYGTASAQSLVQVFADSSNEGQYFIDTLRSGLNGSWKTGFDTANIPSGLINITAIQDSAGNTSSFSNEVFYGNISAGKDTIVCDSSAMLQANELMPGFTGEWSYYNKNNLSDKPVLSDDTNRTTIVKNLNPGKNYFVWKLKSTGTLNQLENTSLTDTVIIKYNKVTNANINDSLLISCTPDLDIKANIPDYSIGEIGKWSVIKGNGNFSEVSNPQTKISNLEKGINIVKWQIKGSSKKCKKEDTLKIKRKTLPKTYNDTMTVESGKTAFLNVISFQEKLMNEALQLKKITNQNLLRDTSFIKNNKIKYRTKQSVSGFDTLTYRICDSACTGFCVDDTLFIHILKDLPFIDAGKDTVVCQSSFQLNASEAVKGWTGKWTYPGKNKSISFNDKNSAKSLVKNLDEGENQLIWTLTKDTTINSVIRITDTINIKYYNPVAEIKVEDFTFCGTDTLLNTQIPDQFEEGAWKVLKGPEDIISNINNTQPKANGFANGINKLAWQVNDTSGNCVNNDTLNIFYSSAGASSFAEDTVTINDTLKLDVFYREALLKGDKLKIDTLQIPEKAKKWQFTNNKDSIKYIPNPTKIGNDTLRFIVNKNSCPADSNFFKITIENASPNTINNSDQANQTVTINISDINKNYDPNTDSGFIITYPLNFDRDQINIINQKTIEVNYSNSNTDSIAYLVCDKSGSCRKASFKVPASEKKSPSAPKIKVFNAVSPNGDGIQDYLKIKNAEFYNKKGDIEVIIFNRWGAEVFRSNDYINKKSKAFHGVSNNNKKLPAGTYYYHITAKYTSKQNETKKTASGYLELKRE